MDINIVSHFNNSNRTNIEMRKMLRTVSYFDIIATGPQGQKTIDHTVVKALKNKEDIANFTTSAWIDALLED